MSAASSPAKTSGGRKSEYGSVAKQSTGAVASAPAGTAKPTGTTDAERVGVLTLSPNTLLGSGSDDGRVVVWVDIDNTLYRKSTKIAELMTQRIQAYFRSIGLNDSEAETLHKRYYKEYGLAIRGLARHHQIDALDYDNKCDATLPLDDILRPDETNIQLLRDLDRSKCRVWALTNAYKTHAVRVLRLLQLEEFFDGIIFCDYGLDNFTCKPEHEFYRGAMQRVGMTDPARCFFVDDSLLNIRAANALGWQSCVLYREEEVESQNDSGVVKANGSIIASKGDSRPQAFSFRTNGSQHGPFDEERIRAEIHHLSPALRLQLLDIVLDACLSSDIAAMKRMLEKRISLTRDMVNLLPDDILLKVFERLPIREILRCRIVSKRWNAISKHPMLWRSHALALTEGDPLPIIDPKNESEWESLVQGLYFRDQNWRKGICQNVTLMPGHTGFVTAMKLKGRTTLVTGSYDETIRVWDLPTGTCKKVLKAKAIACLDFLADEGILAAGLYDTGRVMVWNMKNWTLLQTLSGHNRGIRNVAISQDYLVSVGQDKAIVVWDWRNGTKVVRFGQQSNVSLGVSIVDRDKIVAVTVDGIIRTFDLSSPKKEMIGQFDIAKLTPGLTSRLGGLKDGSHMMQWFAAHRNTITIGSHNLVIHLQWHEHVVAQRQLRIRRDSNESTVSTSSTATVRNQRRSSLTPSQASASASNGTPRRSLATTSVMTPSPTSRKRVESSRQSVDLKSRLSTASTGEGVVNASPRGSTTRSSPSKVKLTPASSLSSSRPTSPATPKSPTMPRASRFAFPVDTDNSESGATRQDETRIAPNLSIAPKVLSIVDTPEGAVGCVDAAKRRIVCASRFSSRAGADRRLYTTTFEEQSYGGHPSTKAQAPTPSTTAQEDLSSPGSNGDKDAVVPIGGAWQAMANKLALPACNPMSLVLDPDHCVVGTSEGLVYVMGFVGSRHKEGWIDPTAEEKDDEVYKHASHGDEDGVDQPAKGQDGLIVVEELVELRHIWSNLFTKTEM